MKRKAIITTVLTLGLIVATGAALVSAQGGDAVIFNASWTFQNLGTSTANVHVDLYNTDGQNVAQDDFDVDTAQSFWAPAYTPLDSVGTFNGAIVASSSEPLASIANQLAQNTTSGKSGNATYMGLTEDGTAPQMYAPVAMKSFVGLYWTEMSIQSTATTGDITVDVHYYNQNGTEVTGSPSSYTVHAGSPTRVAQEDETILPDNWNGAVMVESQDGTTALALIVNEFTGVSGRMYNQFYSYEGFASGSEDVVLPAVFINGYGSFNASASVMNLGDDPATVTWHFFDATTGTEVHSFTESIATSKSVYFPGESYASKLTGASSPTDAWVGSITLESSEPLAAIVNENTGNYWAASYTGLMEGATDIYFPLAFDSAYGFADTSISIADMSGTTGPVNVTVNYIADKTQCSGCTDWSDTYNFTTSDSKYQPTHIPASAKSDGAYVGSLHIHVNTAGKTIHGIMNENTGASSADNFTSFNAFAAP